MCCLTLCAGVEIDGHGTAVICHSTVNVAEHVRLASLRRIKWFISNEIALESHLKLQSKPQVWMILKQNF